MFVNLPYCITQMQEVPKLRGAWRPRGSPLLYCACCCSPYIVVATLAVAMLPAGGRHASRCNARLCYNMLMDLNNIEQVVMALRSRLEPVERADSLRDVLEGQRPDARKAAVLI